MDNLNLKYLHLAWLFFVCFKIVYSDVILENWTTESLFKQSPKEEWTELPGGTIVDGSTVFYRNKSPYRLRNDLIIERDAKLTIEPGVEIRIEPQVGITVRGIITAKVKFTLHAPNILKTKVIDSQIKDNLLECEPRILLLSIVKYLLFTYYECCIHVYYSSKE